MGNLFKNNEFLLRSINASQYVLAGKVVHIPQAGAAPAVVMNRSSLPASVTTRTDTDITYALNEFTTDPIRIANADTIELSYDKRDSVLSESQAALRQVVADNVLVSWAPAAAARIIRTTGTAAAAHLSGATGNRKAFLYKDLKKAQLTMDKQNVPMEDRYSLMSADMIDQLTTDLSVTQYRDFSTAYDAKTGVLGELCGFKIMKRSSVLSYTDDTTPVVKAYGAAGDEDDNDAVLCWQINAVERAIGEIKFFERLGDPTYYSDLYSFLMRMGSRKRRTDEAGLVAIVQAASA